MGTQVSLYRLVNRGCPQGFALGRYYRPFIQNDLPLCIATRPYMYADDHQIYHSGHDLVEVISKLSESTVQATTVVQVQLAGRKPKEISDVEHRLQQDN